MKTEADFKEEADVIRNRIESIVADGDDLINFFTDSIYGMEDDRLIIGFGVYGGAGHILACPTCISVCGVDSEPFSREAMKAMEDMMEMMT